MKLPRLRLLVNRNFRVRGLDSGCEGVECPVSGRGVTRLVVRTMVVGFRV